MFEAINIVTGKHTTIYGVDIARGYFLVADENGKFCRDNMSKYSLAPAPESNSDCASLSELCTVSIVKQSIQSLSEALDNLRHRCYVKLGTCIATRLKDGTNIDLVVTDIDEVRGYVRLESRDCLPDYTSARNLDNFLARVYNLLPDALQERIISVVCRHRDGDGQIIEQEEKLFVPAASEIFPSEDCYGDVELYKQLDWYKDVHNRVRGHGKGGSSCWYWTSSPNGSNDFCCVSYAGAAGYDTAYYTDGLAPFGCIIPLI